MNAIAAITGIMGFIIVAVLLLQPVTLLSESAADILATNNGITKQGTNSDGEIVDVGPASALSDFTSTLLLGIGFFMLLGFVIWLIRGANDSGGDESYKFGFGGRL